jgi:hypothetical protein
MISLVLLTALAQPAPAALGATQPVQVLARIDAKGNLTITSVTSLGSGTALPAMPPPDVVPPKAPAKEPVKVKVTTVVVMTMELPAKAVEAYTTDGRTLPAEKLAELLAKDRPVLVATDGKKVDPFLLQLYKEGTILLVPPPNTINLGPVGQPSRLHGTGGYSDAPPPPPVAPQRIPDRPKQP